MSDIEQLRAFKEVAVALQRDTSAKQREIERLRRLLRVALDARFEDEPPSDSWYESVREVLGLK